MLIQPKGRKDDRVRHCLRIIGFGAFYDFCSFLHPRTTSTNYIDELHRRTTSTNYIRRLRFNLDTSEPVARRVALTARSRMVAQRCAV